MARLEFSNKYDYMSKIRDFSRILKILQISDIQISSVKYTRILNFIRKCTRNITDKIWIIKEILPKRNLQNFENS